MIWKMNSDYTYCVVNVLLYSVYLLQQLNYFGVCDYSELKPTMIFVLSAVG